MFRRLFGKKTKQLSGDITEVWQVRWTSRKGEFLVDVKTETEIFYTKEAAKEFAKALEDAICLLRHSGWQQRVYVERKTL